MRTKDWLKKMRKKFNLTQKDLSEESGVNKLTIENIEQGRRKGSEETWGKIEEYFNKKENSNEPIYSYDSDNLISEIKEDIKEFGKKQPCILIYQIVDDNFIFTNYDLIEECDSFDSEEELEENEFYLETYLKDALEIFEKQNKLF